MIPKKIHFCWLGENQKPDLVKMCLDSWTKNLPDYEIVEWNEEKFSPYSTPFFEEAIKRKRYAFASDYLRARALRDFGGIYLDADVEVKRSFDPYLNNKAFTGFETKGLPFTAVWGSEPRHKLAEIVCNYYETLKTYQETTNTQIVSEIIKTIFGIDPENDNKQLGKFGLCVYPSSTFCVDLEESVAVHHFNGSWLDQSLKISVKDIVAISYHANKLAELNGFNKRETYDAIRKSIGLTRHILSISSRPTRDFFTKLFKISK